MHPSGPMWVPREPESLAGTCVPSSIPATGSCSTAGEDPRPSRCTACWERFCLSPAWWGGLGQGLPWLEPHASRRADRPSLLAPLPQLASSSATCPGPHILREALETGSVDENTHRLRHRKCSLTFAAITTGLHTQTKGGQIVDFN